MGLRLAALLLAGAWGAATAQTGGVPRQGPADAEPSQPGAQAPARGEPGSRPGSADRAAAGTAARAFVLTPGIRASAVASDNIDLSPPGLEQNGGYFELAPYIQATLNSPRSFGTLFYALRGAWYTGSEVLDHSLRHDLRLNGDVALTDQALRLSATAYVFNVDDTPFGVLGSDAATRSSTTTTYKSVEISPYAAGRLTGTMDYELRYRLTYVDPGDNYTSSVGNAIRARVGSGAPTRTFGWDARVDAAQFNYDNDYDYRLMISEVMGYYSPVTDLRLGLGANYASSSVLENEDGDRSGFGPSAAIDWRPAPRTVFAARWSDTYYGPITNARASHATGNLTFGLTWENGVRDGNQAGLIYYDPTRILSTPGTTSAIGTAQQLGQANVVPAAGAPLGVSRLQSPIVEVESLVGSIAYVDVRNTIVFNAFYNDQRPAVVAPGFASIADYAQAGAFVRGSRRLDTVNSLPYGLYYARTESDDLTLSTEAWRADIGWERRFSVDLTGRIEYRYVRQRSEAGAAGSYDENAIVLTLDYRF